MVVDANATQPKGDFGMGDGRLVRRNVGAGIGSDGALEVHREWGEGLLAVGERVLAHSATPTAQLDVRLIVAALDGLRMGVLNSGEEDVEWVRLAVRRQLQALLG